MSAYLAHTCPISLVVATDRHRHFSPRTHARPTTTHHTPKTRGSRQNTSDPKRTQHNFTAQLVIVHPPCDPFHGRQREGTEKESGGLCPEQPRNPRTSDKIRETPFEILSRNMFRRGLVPGPHHPRRLHLWCCYCWCCRLCLTLFRALMHSGSPHLRYPFQGPRLAFRGLGHSGAWRHSCLRMVPLLFYYFFCWV